jgi:mannose-1-phosphate guanylyltransferase
MSITAVTLVGGLGTRLRPITYLLPKQLIPLAGQPTLFHALDVLPSEVTSIRLACGYKADTFEEYLRAHPYRIPIHLVREEVPLGTAGGLRNASEGASDPFALLNGDVISSLDMDQMLRAHRDHGGLGTMSLFEVEDPSPYGVAVLDGEGRIRRFVEKPPKEEAPSHWINAGASIWGRAVFEAIPDPKGREMSFEREILGGLLPRGVYGFTFRGWFEDAGTPVRMLNAQRLLFDHPRQGRFLPRSKLPGAQVVPPVASGKDCRAEGAQVGRYVTLGDRVEIGAGARVEDAILLDDVRVGRGAVVRRSILGPGYQVPPDAVIEDRCLSPEPSTH